MVNRWRIILAAAVIFLAGAASSALVTRVFAPRVVRKQSPATPPFTYSAERRQEYLQRLDRELLLTPEQRKQAEAIVAESQKRINDLWQQIEPQTKQEYQRTRKEISELLTPEQREKMKRMRHGKDREKEKEREKTNAPTEPKPGACNKERNLRVAPVCTLA